MLIGIAVAVAVILALAGLASRRRRGNSGDLTQPTFDRKQVRSNNSYRARGR
jgi:hypothetical protein